MAIRPRETAPKNKVQLRVGAVRYRIDFTYIQVTEGNVSLYPHEHPDGMPSPLELFSNDYFPKDKDGVELTKATIHVPYKCTRATDDIPCNRAVTFKVNGERVCQYHMLKAIQSGTNPEIYPETRGDSIVLHVDEPIPTEYLTMPQPPMAEDEDDD
jgi:hypothetical protein